MIYGVLADLVTLLHFLWIVFVIFGILLVFKKSKFAWVHLGSLLFSLLLNILGWYCPLTYLEQYLRGQGGSAGYAGSFIAHYLEPVIYPRVSETAVRAGGIVFVVVNLAIYGNLVKKRYRSQ
jgi:hypothetical protein